MQKAIFPSPLTRSGFKAIVGYKWLMVNYYYYFYILYSFFVLTSNAKSVLFG